MDHSKEQMRFGVTGGEWSLSFDNEKGVEKTPRKNLQIVTMVGSSRRWPIPIQSQWSIWHFCTHLALNVTHFHLHSAHGMNKISALLAESTYELGSAKIKKSTYVFLSHWFKCVIVKMSLCTFFVDTQKNTFTFRFGSYACSECCVYWSVWVQSLGSFFSYCKV